MFKLFRRKKPQYEKLEEAHRQLLAELDEIKDICLKTQDENARAIDLLELLLRGVDYPNTETFATANNLPQGIESLKQQQARVLIERPLVIHEPPMPIEINFQKQETQTAQPWSEVDQAVREALGH